MVSNESTAGRLAGIFTYGGGAQYPNEAVWMADNANPRLPLLFQGYTATAGNRGPSRNRWGDYFTVQPHASSPNTWAGL